MIFSIGVALVIVGYFGFRFLSSPFVITTLDKFLWFPTLVIGWVFALGSLLSFAWRYLP